MEPLLGWDGGRDGNNKWDLNAVVRFAGGRGPISPPTRTNNPVARYAPPPPQLSYAATVMFHGGLGHQAIAALPPQLHQDLPHPHAAGRWGPRLDLPPLLPEPHHTAAVVVGTHVHQAPPMNPQWPRNEIPMPSVVQPPPADKHTTVPSSSSVRDAAEGSSASRPKKRARGTRTKAKDRKEEVLVPAVDPTPPDSWAWRKYGEKAIIGTPHHRSYYRCSTDRSCKARKHVQRCLKQPNLLEVSYVGEHSHPMPLAVHCQAGKTRPKMPPPPPPPPFIITNNPAKEKENQLLPSAPSAAATSPFAMMIPAAAQGQQRTPAAPPASASSASLLLPAVSAPPPLRIQGVEQPPQASATALAPPASLIEIPSRESQPQPQAPALLAPVPYSLSPNTQLLPSPLLNIPVPDMEAQQQPPAPPANASLAWLPPVSPLLGFQADEWPTQIPAPGLPPPSVVSTLMSPTTALLPPPSVEFDSKEDDDAVALRKLLEDMDDMDMDMTPEDALMFVDPEEEPLDGVGVGDGDGDGLLIQRPQELAALSYYGDAENMIYPMAYDEPASGGSGSNNSLMFPPVQTPTAIVVDEIFSPRHDERLPPLQPAAASCWDFEW